jgi:hypothetical protein
MGEAVRRSWVMDVSGEVAFWFALALFLAVYVAALLEGRPP